MTVRLPRAIDGILYGVLNLFPADVPATIGNASFEQGDDFTSGRVRVKLTGNSKEPVVNPLQLAAARSLSREETAAVRGSCCRPFLNGLGDAAAQSLDLRVRLTDRLVKLVVLRRAADF